MVHDIAGYPFKLFSLLLPGSTPGEIDKCFSELKSACCVDSEFTSPLLSKFSADDEGREKLLAFLGHVASFAPTNSDAVEVKHGQMQWAVSKRSAQFVKKAKSALETTLLQSVVRQHSVVHHQVFGETMPARRSVAAVRRQVGVPSSNQHSKKVHEQMDTAEAQAGVC